MGDSADIAAGDPLRKSRRITVKYFSLRSGATDIVLLRNGREIARRQWSRERDTVEFVDRESLDNTAIRDSRFHPEPFTVYYVRAEESYGQTQWSSPIWLDS